MSLLVSTLFCREDGIVIFPSPSHTSLLTVPPPTKGWRVRSFGLSIKKVTSTRSDDSRRAQDAMPSRWLDKHTKRDAMLARKALLAVLPPAKYSSNYYQ